MPVRNLNYDVSMRKSAEAFGLKLLDIPEFGCCGYPLGSLDYHTMFLLSARNLCIAEEKGVEVVTGCTGCAGTRTPTVLPPAVTMSGTALDRCSTRVRAPGRK